MCSDSLAATGDTGNHVDSTRRERIELKQQMQSKCAPSPMKFTI